MIRLQSTIDCGARWRPSKSSRTRPTQPAEYLQLLPSDRLCGRRTHKRRRWRADRLLPRYLPADCDGQRTAGSSHQCLRCLRRASPATRCVRGYRTCGADGRSPPPDMSRCPHPSQWNRGVRWLPRRLAQRFVPEQNPRMIRRRSGRPAQQGRHKPSSAGQSKRQLLRSRLLQQGVRFHGSKGSALSAQALARRRRASQTPSLPPCHRHFRPWLSSAPEAGDQPPGRLRREREARRLRQLSRRSSWPESGGTTDRPVGYRQAKLSCP